MSTRNITIPSSNAIASGASVTVALPAGTIAADYSASGAYVRAFQSNQQVSVSITDNGITFTWPFAQTLPAGGTASLSVRTTEDASPLGASEQHIGQLGGHTARPSVSFTRPADTTAYAVGDLVANSTTAGSVTPMSFTVGRTGTAGGMIRRARLRKSGTSVTNASFRLHLYSASPTASNGDNGAWLTDKASNYVGAIDITVDKAFTDGAAGNGVPAAGSEINCTAQTYYGLLEARGAYTPASGETFSLELEVIQN